MNVLGFSGFHNSVQFKAQQLPGLPRTHSRIVQGLDSAAALVTHDGVRSAAAQERFCREKGTGAFPTEALDYCLRSEGLTYSDVDYLAHGFDYEPYRDLFENASEQTQAEFHALYSSDAVASTLTEMLPDSGLRSKLVPVEHHLAHAASAYYLSGFQDSLVLVADGMGEVHCTSIGVACDNDIHFLEQVPALHSLGILYGLFTLYLGFVMNMDEYKVMGLASFGNRSHYFGRLRELVLLKDDGTYEIPILFANSTLYEKETYEGSLCILENSFGPRRAPGAPITPRHYDIAAALQAVLEESLLHILSHFQRQAGMRSLCMAGGVALNCTANGVIRRSGLFDHVFVQPAAGDDGTALGAALYVQAQMGGPQPRARMGAPLWGPGYDQQEICQAIERCTDCTSTYFACFDELIREVARRIADGQILAWFQGRMEFGPRALGNRSILADPRDAEMRERLNRVIKKREDFRPFAPAVKAEAASKYFEITPGDEQTYSHMLFTAPVRPEYRQQLPAVTHIDGTARVQTVTQRDNPRFAELLDAFQRITGFPILLNTSFNGQGEPIVCSPTDALRTFGAIDLDALVLGNYLVERAAK